MDTEIVNLFPESLQRFFPSIGEPMLKVVEECLSKLLQLPGPVPQYLSPILAAMGGGFFLMKKPLGFPPPGDSSCGTAFNSGKWHS